MGSLAFDTLRYARRLRDAGVPEPQADVQAEIMGEALASYSEQLLTKEHFSQELNTRFTELDVRFAEIDSRFTQVDARFVGLESRFERRFLKIERVLLLHTWMLGLITVVLVVPQLQAWLA